MIAYSNNFVKLKPRVGKRDDVFEETGHRDGADAIKISTELHRTVLCI